MLSKKGACFLILGAILLINVVQSIPLDLDEISEEEESYWAGSIMRVETTAAPEATTSEAPETTTGWSSVVPTGETAAFGQTLLIEDMAALNNNSDSSILEATAADGEYATISVNNTLQSDMEINTNSWAPGGGNVAVGPITSSVDGAYNEFLQGGVYDSSVVITGLSAGGIISNPITSAGVSAGQIVVSSSGQATNGTNVNPGANQNDGWGWGNQGNGWDQGSVGWRVETESTTPAAEESGWGSGWGWPAPQDGETASASSLEAISQLSQQATASDNITAIAVNDGEEPLNLAANINAPLAVELGVNGNGVAIDGDNFSGETQWQNFDVNSYSGNNSTLSVTNADAVALSAQPNSTTTVSFGGIVASDWVSGTSGSNLVNQNNNAGWGSGGWTPGNQGWRPTP